MVKAADMKIRLARGPRSVPSDADRICRCSSKAEQRSRKAQGWGSIPLTGSSLLVRRTGMRTIIGEYVLDMPDDLVFSTFECTDYYGIQFVHGGVKYDVLSNRYMGERLFIAEGPYAMRDIPVHLGTAGLLPDSIKVEKKPALPSSSGLDP